MYNSSLVLFIVLVFSLESFANPKKNIAFESMMDSFTSMALGSVQDNQHAPTQISDTVFLDRLQGWRTALERMPARLQNLTLKISTSFLLLDRLVWEKDFLFLASIFDRMGQMKSLKILINSFTTGRDAEDARIFLDSENLRAHITCFERNFESFLAKIILTHRQNFAAKEKNIMALEDFSPTACLLRTITEHEFLEEISFRDVVTSRFFCIKKLPNGIWQTEGFSLNSIVESPITFPREGNHSRRLCVGNTKDTMTDTLASAFSPDSCVGSSIVSGSSVRSATPFHQRFNSPACTSSFFDPETCSQSSSMPSPLLLSASTSRQFAPESCASQQIDEESVLAVEDERAEYEAKRDLTNRSPHRKSMGLSALASLKEENTLKKLVHDTAAFRKFLDQAKRLYSGSEIMISQSDDFLTMLSALADKEKKLTIIFKEDFFFSCSHRHRKKITFLEPIFRKLRRLERLDLKFQDDRSEDQSKPLQSIHALLRCELFEMMCDMQTNFTTTRKRNQQLLRSTAGYGKFLLAVKKHPHCNVIGLFNQRKLDAVLTKMGNSTGWYITYLSQEMATEISRISPLFPIELFGNVIGIPEHMGVPRLRTRSASPHCFPLLPSQSFSAPCVSQDDAPCSIECEMLPTYLKEKAERSQALLNAPIYPVYLNLRARINDQLDGAPHPSVRLLDATASRTSPPSFSYPVILEPRKRASVPIEGSDSAFAKRMRRETVMLPIAEETDQSFAVASTSRASSTTGVIPKKRKFSSDASETLLKKTCADESYIREMEKRFYALIASAGTLLDKATQRAFRKHIVEHAGCWTQSKRMAAKLEKLKREETGFLSEEKLKALLEQTVCKKENAQHQKITDLTYDYLMLLRHYE